MAPYHILLILSLTSSWKFIPHVFRQHQKVNAINFNKPIRSSSLTLSSSSIGWDKIPLDYDDEDDHKPKEAYMDQETLKRFRLLGGNATEEIITADELKSRWIDICIDEMRPDDIDSISLSQLLPSIMKPQVIIQIENETAIELDQIDNPTLYITEQELKKLWLDQSVEPMGKPLEEYSVEHALLYLPDAEMDEVMGFSENETVSTILALPKLVTNTEGFLEVDGDNGLSTEVEEEIIISEQELKRIWDVRSEIPWGMPSKEFSTLSALLLLDSDNIEDDPLIQPILVAAGIPVTEYLPSINNELEEDDFWTQFEGTSNQYLRETLKRIHDDLEGQDYLRTPWKKNRRFLTPDIDTQDFMGDIMWSNTYLTERIPANWDDPETDEMSETYLSTGTMAWPGEPETDYNVFTPIWEELNLPFGPKYVDGTGLTSNLIDPIEAEEMDKLKSQNADLTLLPDGEVDWDNFDFDAVKTEDETENEINAEKPFASDMGTFLESIGQVEEKEEDDNSRGILSSVEQFEDLLNDIDGEDFDIPPEWLEKPEFKDHVGHEEWSQYENLDDLIWDEDVFMAQSINHVLKVTDLYLTNHDYLTKVADERNYWDRQVASHLLEKPWQKEDIPIYLTPDINRGVKYGDEIIEMKGKITLHPFQEDPAIEFKDDIFTHNNDTTSMSKIGTISEQYEWTPDEGLKPYKIEKKKLEKIGDILSYINHCGTLLSTKDNILVFDYKGQMRHVVGIRNSMLALAKECDLDIKDIRLETTKTADKFDL